MAAVIVGVLVFVPFEKGRENTKIRIDDRYSFTFQFSEKPKVGTTILKISVLDQKGEKTNDLNISASYAMPSMKNMGSKSRDFMLSKKGDYLLPIDATMLGDWEIEVIFKDNSHEIHREKILFTI